MPIYEYRCTHCDNLTERYFSSTDAPRSLVCKHCNIEGAQRIISGAFYHASEATTTAKLDPKYEKKVDHAMRNSQSADENRLLNRMKRF